MVQTIKKALKTGYGLGLLSLDQAQKVAGTVRKELHLNDEESRKLAHELVKNSGQASREVLAVAGKYFESALVRTGVASKKELAAAKRMVKKKLHRLQRKEQSVFSKVRERLRR